MWYHQFLVFIMSNINISDRFRFPASAPLIIASDARWYTTNATANGGKLSILGLMKSKTKCTNFSDPLNTNLAATMTQKNSIETWSENYDSNDIEHWIQNLL